MQGEFRGDVSRDSFRPDKGFLRVLMQQGRVLLDADWNEQTAILLHYIRTLATDLFGAHFGSGFEVENPANNKFDVTAGWYYVNGLRCETSGMKGDTPVAGKPYLVYLDVWERHVTADEEADLREVALGQADTASRSKVACRVRSVKLGNPVPESDDLKQKASKDSQTWLRELDVVRPGTGTLAARTAPAADVSSNPCAIAGGGGYRGLENQLYRVEVIERVPASEPNQVVLAWSRDNSSVTYPILSVKDATVTLEHLGRDERALLRVGDLVEVVPAGSDFKEPRTLWEVVAVDPDTRLVTLSGSAGSGAYLRRWDGQHSLVPAAEPEWSNLEDGLQIRLTGGNVVGYQVGDYWLIPARASTGAIDWPVASQPPHGVQHHYAPLAIVDGGTVHSCRRVVGTDLLKNS